MALLTGPASSSVFWVHPSPGGGTDLGPIRSASLDPFFCVAQAFYGMTLYFLRR
jgi:hypothetical protein